MFMGLNKVKCDIKEIVFNDMATPSKNCCYVIFELLQFATMATDLSYGMMPSVCDFVYKHCCLNV